MNPRTARDRILSPAPLAKLDYPCLISAIHFHFIITDLVSFINREYRVDASIKLH